MSKLDPEEFQAWKDSPLTQQVLRHFRDRAQRELEMTQQALLQVVGQSSQTWADQQGQAAYLKGHCDAFIEVADVVFEDIEDSN